MTPRNQLDKKVIVDREVLENLLIESRQLSQVLKFNFSASKTAQAAAERALAADLTGWAAVPVNFNLKMYYAGADEKTVRETYRAMLAASPPLPGGGE